MQRRPAFVALSFAGLLALMGSTAGAGAPETKITPVAAADLPAQVVSAVKAAAPGLTIRTAELKEREARRYFDVEGVLADGSEIEFDLLETAGVWAIVETQRDIDWTSAPAAVQDAARAAQAAVAPVRVIESRQNDGMIIYELFAAGQPRTPAMEVSWKDGQARVLAEVWPH